jgi:glycosyltransferase involved in cell wall biosynthesis
MSATPLSSKTIAVVMGVYNEGHRLEQVLLCFQWAREIIVFVKKSTDNTLSIAQKYATRVIQIPYTDGHSEEIPEYLENYSGECTWFFFVTASSLITPALAKRIIDITDSSDCQPEVIGLPLKMYVLGIHHRRSPWGETYKRVLLKRNVYELGTLLHKELSYNSSKILDLMPINEDDFFYHLTNETPADMISRITRYTYIEAKQLLTGKEKDAVLRHIYDFLKLLVLIFIRRKTFLMKQGGWFLIFSFLLYPMLKYIQIWYTKNQDKLDSYPSIRVQIVKQWSDRTKVHDFN